MLYRCWAIRLLLGACLFVPSGVGRTDDEKSGNVDDYNQWKQALGSGQATDARTISAPAGFVVELLRSAQPGEGSWISLAFDPRGRLLIAREDRGLLRLPRSAVAADPQAADKLEIINDSLLECRGLLWAYDGLYANANNSKGLYRLDYHADTDRFDPPRLLRATPGNVGHGRNDLALGPDGMIYSIYGDDVQLPPDFPLNDSPLRHFRDDRVLPCAWDEQLYNASMQLPGGHLVRTDREGKTWELLAGGMRNPYGVDFNADGELFTFDADMEWDVGMPWYRPNRVLHLASGVDYGWRRGTGTWKAWYPESLPAVVDTGLGSPTAIQFGTRSHFPARYRQSLFLLDWAYGRIMAIHMTPKGSSYEGQSETFVSGRPLNVTDLAFGPDGAMYFLTGGRKTQSGLYRVRYQGPADSEAALAEPQPDHLAAAAEARQLRRKLEALHGQESPDGVAAAWPYLSSEDAGIRHAARLAIEHRPPAMWRDRVFSESQNTAAVTSLLALARVGEAVDREPLVARFIALPWAELTAEQRLAATRALSLTLARWGQDESQRPALLGTLDQRYPDPSTTVNQLLCEVLVALRAPSVVAKTLALVVAAPTQEEKFHYLVTLRSVRVPWSVAERRTYVGWLREARDFYGAQYLPRYLQWLRDDVLQSLTADETRQFAALLTAPPAMSETATIQRPHVRNWQLEDLAGSLIHVESGRDFQRGEQTFAAALCVRCHRMGPHGSPVGPDLTQVARRFGRRGLLLSILAPAHVVDEKYRAMTVVTTQGKVLVGQVLGPTEDHLTVIPDLLFPDQVTKLPLEEVESQTPALVSTMPAGLLNTFSKDEILDLLAYLEAGGQAGHPSFQPSRSPK